MFSKRFLIAASALAFALPIAARAQSESKLVEEWEKLAGSDAKRGASKWRCPAGECSPASVWVKADRLHTLVPRSTSRWMTGGPGLRACR